MSIAINSAHRQTVRRTLRATPEKINRHKAKKISALNTTEISEKLDIPIIEAELLKRALTPSLQQRWFGYAKPQEIFPNIKINPAGYWHIDSEALLSHWSIEKIDKQFPLASFNPHYIAMLEREYKLLEIDTKKPVKEQINAKHSIHERHYRRIATNAIFWDSKLRLKGYLQPKDKGLMLINISIALGLQ